MLDSIILQEAGIANMGNTSFMNAILQCFTHTVQMFLGLRYCTHASSCKDLYLFSVEFLGIL